MIKIVLAASFLLPFQIDACQVCIDYAFKQLQDSRKEWHNIVIDKKFDYGAYRQYLGACSAYRDMYELLILMHSGDQD